MKLLYIANIRLPTEKAHGIQIMKMCEAFVRAGMDVELLVPNRYTAITQNPFEYYGIKEKFTIKQLPVLDTIRWGKIGFLFESFLFALQVKKYVSTHNADLLYSRDELILFFVPKKKYKVIWETHTGAWNILARRVAKRVSSIVAISFGLKEFYVQHGILENKIIVAHDGVDLEDFFCTYNKEEAKHSLNLPTDKKIVMYAGSLGGWKGVETLLQASELLSNDVSVVIIGGTSEEIADLKKHYKKVTFLGYRPYRELPYNQSAADLLILPNTRKNEISSKFTSPLKLFTYMASGVPIISSDLPSIREVLSDDMGFFVEPDNPHALAEKIQISLKDPDIYKKGKTAQEWAKNYTWSNRAAAILNFLTSI